MLELLDTIGRAKPGTMMLVIEPFDAISAMGDGMVHLPHGTKLRSNVGTGSTLSAIADFGDQLRRVYIFAEQFHCLAVEP